MTFEDSVRVMVVREAPMDRLASSGGQHAAHTLVPGQPLLWDNRFVITLLACEPPLAPRAYLPLPRPQVTTIAFDSPVGASSGPHHTAADGYHYRVVRFNQTDYDKLFVERPDLQYMIHKIPREARYGLPVICKVGAPSWLLWWGEPQRVGKGCKKGVLLCTLDICCILFHPHTHDAVPTTRREHTTWAPHARLHSPSCTGTSFVGCGTGAPCRLSRSRLCY